MARRLVLAVAVAAAAALAGGAHGCARAPAPAGRRGCGAGRGGGGEWGEADLGGGGRFDTGDEPVVVEDDAGEDGVEFDPQGVYRVAGRLALEELEEVAAAQVTLHLNGADGLTKTMPLRDGGFAFPAVAPGLYVLQVYAPTVIYANVRVEISERTQKFPGGVRASLLDDPNKVYRYPLVIRPAAKANYFEEKQQMLSLKTLAKNPMYLIIGITVLVSLVLPKMLDPETVEEMKKEMAASQNQGQRQRRLNEE